MPLPNVHRSRVSVHLHVWFAACGIHIGYLNTHVREPDGDRNLGCLQCSGGDLRETVNDATCSRCSRGTARKPGS